MELKINEHDKLIQIDGMISIKTLHMLTAKLDKDWYLIKDIRNYIAPCELIDVHTGATPGDCNEVTTRDVYQDKSKE